MKLLSGRSHLARLGSKGSVHPGHIRRETSTSRRRSHPTPASLSSIEQEEEEESISDSTSAAMHHTSFIDSQWFRDRGEEKASPPVSLFRFWHDEKKFKGNGENSLAQRALLRLGGQRTGGHVKSAPSTGPLGHQRKSAWDVLWSPSSYSHKCFEGPLRPSAVISAVPGTQCLTKKKRLSQTLFSKWGDEAWDLLMPRTFSLPSEVNLMMEWTKGRSLTTPALAEELWMLKTAQHLGLGLKLVPLRGIFKEMVAQFNRSQEAKKAGVRNIRPYVSAQLYVKNPLLIDGRKFGLRVWVCIVKERRSADFKFYLHQNGLVLFSNTQYQDSMPSGADQVPSFAVTNYAMNRDGSVWPLNRLEVELGREKFEAMQTDIRRILSMTFESSRDHLDSATKKDNVQCSCFELFGVDILVDSTLKSWILEVNATPSLEVCHKDEATEEMIYHMKNEMVEDLFQLLDIPGRFTGNGSFRPSTSDGAGGWKRLERQVLTDTAAEPINNQRDTLPI